LSDDGVRLTRRRLLGGAGLVGTGVVLGAGGAYGVDRAAPGDASGTPAESTVPFYGPHQAGITTPQQSRLVFAAFDLITSDVDAV
jgi:deferrochelatase/peroxidase EfeB